MGMGGTTQSTAVKAAWPMKATILTIFGLRDND